MYAFYFREFSMKDGLVDIEDVSNELSNLYLTLLDPGYFFPVRSGGGGRFRPPLNISPRTTFEVGLNYYPRKV